MAIIKGTLIILLIFFVLLITSFIIDAIVRSKCREECVGELDSTIVKSGNWALDDLCICYYSDSIKAFRLGE